MDRLILAIDGLPLKVNQILPTDVVINANPPALGFTLAQEIASNRQLRCFNSTYGKLSVDRIGPLRRSTLSRNFANRTGEG